MFGHDDKDNEDKDKTTVDSSAANDNPSGGQDWQHPGTPIDDKTALDDKPDDSPTDTTTPASDDEPAASAPTVAEEPSAPAEPSVEPAEPAEASTPAIGSADDLIDIKQDALHKLSPLIDHLDQSPEDKFRTLMMMIQASDDQSLVKQAYETAQEISDEKERAQALLDIVNEINYFTQTPAKPE